MKQKVQKNVWLRISMLAAVMLAFVGTTRAEIHPIDVELEGFTATSGQIDGNISFSTTGGSANNGVLSFNTLTLTATNNAKINSVTFHYPSTDGVNAQWVINGSTTDFFVNGPANNPTISDLSCDNITIKPKYDGISLVVDYISVTYTPGNPDYTITALSNDNAKGTVEPNGNVIVAHPNAGYSIDEENPFTVTDGEADVIPYGSKYIAVVPSSNCTIVINFVPHAGSLSLDFEHSSNADWNCTGFDRSKSDWPKPHGGTYMGKMPNGTNTASIQTIAQIGYPETFSCWICPIASTSSPVSWKVQVSSDNSTWRDVGNELSYVVTWESEYQQNNWYQISADLSSETNVYVRLYYSGAQAAVDDVVLTTKAAPEVTTIPVTISNAGYATFVPGENVSIPASLTAYKVTGATSTSVTMEEVTAVPAGSAVVVKGAAGTYDLTVIESADALSGNLLYASNGDVTGAAGNIYALANKTNGVGFYRVATNVTIPAGKAYLVIGVPASDAKAFYGFEDNPTAIEMVNGQSSMVNEIYNLAGQRLQKMQKGINIINGKKILR